MPARLPSWISSTWSESQSPDQDTPPARDPPPDSYRSPRGRRGRLRELGVALALLLVVVLLVAWTAGVGPFQSSPKGSASQGTNAPTYSQAASSALALANASAHGPWSAGLAVAVVTSASQPFQSFWAVIARDVGGVECNFKISTSTAWNATLAGFGGSRVLGESTGWLIVVTNETERGLVVLVSGGQASVLGSFGGRGCADYLYQIGSIPAGYLDSPNAVQGALVAGGSAFLSAHPNANVTMWAPAPDPSLNTDGNGWLVTFSTCPLVEPWNGTGNFGPFGGDTFSVLVNETGGAVQATNFSSYFGGCSVTGFTVSVA